MCGYVVSGMAKNAPSDGLGWSLGNFSMPIQLVLTSAELVSTERFEKSDAGKLHSVLLKSGKDGQRNIS